MQLLFVILGCHLVSFVIGQPLLKESLFSKARKQAEEHQRWTERQEQKQRVKYEKNASSSTQVGFARLRELNDKMGTEKDFYAETSLPAPYDMLSFGNFSGVLPISMSENERTGRARCTYHGARCPMEIVEHQLVDRFLSPDDTVLEVCARFGTTSCTIAAKQGNSGRLVAVEPDSSVWHLLAHNQQQHRCSFWVMRGVVSNQGHSLSPHSYGTRTQKTGPRGANLSFREIQKAVGLRFNALLIDCEGCIDSLFLEGDESQPSLETIRESLKDVHTIILEADMSHLAPDCYKDCVHYEQWTERLQALGFEKVHQQADPRFWFIFHYVFQRR